MNEALALAAVGLLAFAAISLRVRHTVLTAPMFFTAFGLAVSPLLVSDGSLHTHAGWVHMLAEITLVVILFTDASRIDLRSLRREHDLPVRMLAIGLPLTVLAGTAAAALLFPGVSLAGAALLAAILAPTDAALGQAVVASRAVPVRIRQALNVESGLNDGIVLPAVLIFLSLAEIARDPGKGAGHWMQFAALQITLGPIVGVVVGYLGGRLVQGARQARWMNETFERLSVLGLAVLAFAAAELVGGNGFIAAFVGGLVLGNTARAVCTCLAEFGEAEGQLLALLTFSVFGAILVPVAWQHLNVATVLYAVLSLTVVRMLPVALSLAGKGLQLRTVGFLGWFGPRGIASILFALVVVEESGLPYTEQLVGVVATTVFLSVFAHGVTAVPGAAWYARHITKPEILPDSAEHKVVAELPLRCGASPGSSGPSS